MARRTFGPTRVFFDRILQRSYWIWRKHPVIIVPTILGMALLLTVDSIISLATIILETIWASTGTLLAILTEARNYGLLSLLQYQPASSSFIPAFVVSIFLLVFVGIIGMGYIYSCEYGIYVEAWSNETVSVRSLLVHGSRNWKAMAWTFLLSTLVTWGPTIVGLALVIGSSFSLNRILLLGSILLLAPLFIASAILSIFTTYSYPAVAVDGHSGLKAIRQSFKVASHSLGITLTYWIVQLTSQGLLVLAAVLTDSFASPVQALTSAVEVILIFILVPIFHLTKTMIYFYARPSVPRMLLELHPSIWKDVLRALPKAALKRVKMGLSEVAQYVVGPGNLLFHFASIALFVIGTYVGYYVSVNGWASFLLSTPGYRPGQGNPVINQIFLPFLSIDIFLHNWIVSFATMLSGLGLAVPSSVAILYTGFTLGRLLNPQISSFTMFAAIILPHGIIEIPSFLLAGSVGTRLGFAVVRSKLSPSSDSEEYLVNSLRTALYVATGLLIFFLVAGVIEGDITPHIARMFGWTF